MVVDAGKKDKLRIFHVIVFSIGLILITFVALKPDLLQHLWKFVGVERGADFLVYISIISLGIIVFSLIQYIISQQQELTRLVTAQALRDYHFYKTDIIPSNINNKDKFLFLIRAYNEATIIGSVVDEIIQAGFSKIIICNDWSSDNTEQVINNKIQHYGNITIINLSHLINRGPGAANKTLFTFAKQHMKNLWCERAVSYDADGQMNITDMNTFIEKTQTHQYDVILWSRFIKWGKTSNLPFIRRIILQGGRIITYIFNGIWLTDVSTWYRVYNIHAINNIKIMSDRFSYQNDIIESIRRAKLRFTEIPVHINYTDYSISKWQSNMSALKILIRLIYSSLFQK